MPVILLLLAWGLAAAGAPPTNDHFVAAQRILGWDDWITTDNREATGERGEPRVEHRSDRSTVWYYWDAPAAGWLRFSPISSSSGYTEVAVFTGTTVRRLKRVALNAAHDPSDYRFALTAQAGTRYFVALDSSEGRGVLRLRGDFTTLRLTGFTNHQPILGSESQVLQVNAGLVDVDGTLAGVTYFTGERFDEIRLGSSSTAPFAVVASNLPSGSISLWAVATNTAGRVRLTAPVTLEVSPANDAFTNAIPLAGYEFSVFGTTRNATAERGERLHGGARHSRWWSWTAPSTGRLHLEDLEFSSSPRLPISVSVGADLRSLKQLRLRRSSRYGSLQLDVVRGQTYHLAVAGQRSNRDTWFFVGGWLESAQISSPPDSSSFTDAQAVPLGITTTEHPQDIERVEYFAQTSLIAVATNFPFTATWTNVTPGSYCLQARVVRHDHLVPLRADGICIVVRPHNDHFTNATIVETNFAMLNGWFNGATQEPGEPSLAPVSGRTVWWSWTAAEDGFLVLAAVSGGSFVRAGIFTGDTVQSVVSIASTTRPPGEFDPSGSRLQIPVSAGVTYRVAAGDSYSASAVFRLQFYRAPTNDHFASRQFITENTNLLHAQFVGATSEAGEPATAFSQTNTLWWTWTASASGVLSISTPGWIEGYRGESLATLGPVSPLPAIVRAGETWQLRARANWLFQETALIDFRFAPVATNDTFASRRTFSGTNEAFTANPIAATREAGEPAHGPFAAGRSLWWSWTAPAHGDVRLEGYSFLAVYQGDAVTALTPVTQSFGTTVFGTTVFRATAGQTYHIALDPSAHSIDVTGWQFRFFAAPGNDSFHQATHWDDWPVAYALALAGASLETGEPGLGSNDERSIWFRWTAPASGAALVACGGALVSVFTGHELDELTPTGLRNYEDAVILNAQAGSHYWIKVAGSSDFLFGITPRSLVVKPYVAPTNDAFANTVWLTNTAGQIRSENWGATLEPGEPNGNSLRRTLWYRWIAPATGRLMITNAPGAPLASIALCLGSNLAQVARLGPNVSYFVVPVLIGEDFRWQVDGLNGAGGAIRLDYLFEPAPPNDEFEHATSLSGASAVLSGSTHAATTEFDVTAPWARFFTRDIWWRWTAPSVGSAVLSNMLSGISNPVEIYTGTSRSNRILIATKYADHNSTLVFPASGGTTYHVKISRAFNTDAVEWQLFFQPDALTAVWKSSAPEASCVLEASTNLMHWETVQTIACDTDLRAVVAARSKELPAAFFRLRPAP